MQNSADRSRFRRRLLDWFDQNARDLPWRRKKSLYRTWVSEIMLQQTQVVTVVEFFPRFIRRFPDVPTLANASEADVLKQWEGLGYYRRARQMHAAVQVIVDRHEGKFPDTFDEVIALPGIGRYTAGAILSIADDQPWPVLEGNTARVYSRLLDFDGDVTTSAGQQELWSFAESLVSRSRPGDLNQALMELGSEICTVRAPRCLECPVSRHCLAFQQGDPQSLPNKGTRGMVYEDLQQAAVVIRRGTRVVVRLCGPNEHWSGLWDFPRFTSTPSATRAKLARQVGDRTGLSIRLDQPFRQIRHAVTRFRITLDCYEATDVSGRLRRSKDLRWADINELDDLAMSVTGRKIARAIQKR